MEDIRLRPTAFQRTHVVEEPEQELATLIFVLDKQEEQPAVRRLRDWALEALAPAAGETAVDVGCGTGAEVVRMATLVGPAGRAVGVEPHPGLRAEAERRAAGRASFVDGEAERLPFDDGSVDVLRSERVWQHLPDPARAAQEVARVLAPGGRAVIIDSDWGTAVQRSGDQEVVRRFLEASQRRMANPFAGRHLRGLLAGAGLTVDPDIGSAALVLPDDMMRAGVFFKENARLAVDEGALSQEEADTMVADIAAAAEVGEAFTAVTMFAVLARHP